MVQTRDDSDHGTANYCVHCSSRPEINEIYNALLRSLACSVIGIAKRE